MHSIPPPATVEAPDLLVLQRMAYRRALPQFLPPSLRRLQAIVRCVQLPTNHATATAVAGVEVAGSVASHTCARCEPLPSARRPKARLLTVRTSPSSRPALGRARVGSDWCGICGGPPGRHACHWRRLDSVCKPLFVGAMQLLAPHPCAAGRPAHIGPGLGGVRLVWDLWRTSGSTCLPLETPGYGLQASPRGGNAAACTSQRPRRFGLAGQHWAGPGLGLSCAGSVKDYARRYLKVFTQSTVPRRRLSRGSREWNTS